MFEKTTTAPVVYDKEERRRWCIEQATKVFGAPSTAPELIDRAKVIEAWLLESQPA